MKEILTKAILRRALEILQKKWQSSPAEGRLETFKQYLSIVSQLPYPPYDFVEAARNAKTMTELEQRGFKPKEFMSSAVAKFNDAAKLIYIIGRLLDWIDEEPITLGHIGHLFPSAFYPQFWWDVIETYMEEAAQYVAKAGRKASILCPHCYIFEGESVKMKVKNGKLTCPKCGLSEQPEDEHYEDEWEDEWSEEWDEDTSPFARYVDFVGADETDFWRDGQWSVLIEAMERAANLAKKVSQIAPNFKELVDKEKEKLDEFIREFEEFGALETLAGILGGENIITNRRTEIRSELGKIMELYEETKKSIHTENEMMRLRRLAEFYRQLGDLVVEMEQLLQEGHQTGFLGLALLPQFDVSVKDVAQLAKLLKDAEEITEEITRLRSGGKKT